jgi:hypothetical protein
LLDGEPLPGTHFDSLVWNPTLNLWQLRSVATSFDLGLDVWAELATGTFIGNGTQRAGYTRSNGSYSNATEDTVTVLERTATSVSLRWVATLQPLTSGPRRQLVLELQHWPLKTVTEPTPQANRAWLVASLGDTTPAQWLTIVTTRPTPDTLYVLASAPDTVSVTRLSLRAVQPANLQPGLYQLGNGPLYAQFTRTDSTVVDLSGTAVLLGRVANQRLTLRLLPYNGQPFRELLLYEAAW